MIKVRVKLAILGHLPHSLETEKVVKWKSQLFEIVPPIDSYTITADSDGDNWQFTDENILKQLPETFDGDILIAVTNVPIELNYFARRFSKNRICMTYFEMSEILNQNNIPLENLIYRVLYSASFVYKRYGNRIPLMSEDTNFAHDETKGCIFDMNGIKTDIYYSTNKPNLCEPCVQALTTARVEKNLIDAVQKELKRIKKRLYFRMLAFVKVHPVWAIIISSLTAITLGTIGSLIASLIWEKLLKAWIV